MGLRVMSMNFSEFKQQLGADPASQDADFLRARESAPEFVEAAAQADQFERQLRAALAVREPDNLLKELAALTEEKPVTRSIWRHYAVAAGVLLVVALAGITWRMYLVEPSIDKYVAGHYAFDGNELLASGEGQVAGNIAEVLETLSMRLDPDFAATVSFIKFCQTPLGIGAHLVVNTPTGAVTVLFMPGVDIKDGQMLEFEGMQAQLVSVKGGAVAVIGTPDQQVSDYHAVVQDSFVPLTAGA